MEIYLVLGEITAFLLILNICYYLVKLYYKRHKFSSKEAKQKFIQRMKKISIFHRYNGIIIVILAIIHGTLALGTIFTLHTGTILLSAIIINLLIYVLGRLKLLKKWLLIHRYMAFLIFIFLIIHLTVPSLFG
ncbi:hypothetical protein [Geotoga petraea]|uniref:Uncharacterized protein n=1 Tax=Geotoga petraea TaxID=28234 RepID=A0A1G6HLT0_9BACT|nr:hypothetical protein [Geotoga petraea]SDB95202.1 hypothetical protein SAMN04488588_0003 [Geotoga petraea]